MAREKMPDVIVLVPGIMGSVLQKNGRDVWAPSWGAAMARFLTRGVSFGDLILREDSLEDDIGDGIAAVRLMPDFHIIPGLWKIDGYSKISQTIKTVFDVREGENYFEFPYDWRRDLRVVARRLQRVSQEWLAAWRAASGNNDAKLILVGHSMGGLVSRYFLEVLDGWQDTRALVTFGSPHHGSLNALRTLTDGVRKGPLVLEGLTEVARSLTSVYQLLPIYPCYDAGDGKLSQVGEVKGIPNVDAKRAASALAVHREIIRAVEQHQEESDYERGSYRIYTIIGIEQPTLQSARRSRDAVTFLDTLGGTDRRGDGTVPRVSATPHEFLDAPRDEMYESTRHGSIQNADAVLTHLTGVLTSRRIDFGSLLAPLQARASLAMQIEDVYWTDEPVSVSVRPDREGVELEAIVARTDPAQSPNDAVVARLRMVPANDGWHQAQVGPLPEGIYRVIVTGQAGVEPVADIFSVLDYRSGVA
jgi:pimeloyl-ACP methyl ester carboxylesterase